MMTLCRLAIFACLVSACIVPFVPPAPGQDRELLKRCLSIANVDERVDCLESGGASSDTSQTQRSTPTARTGPSFDCRAASHSIERAICTDGTLAEWDARLGQQFQQARRSKKPGEVQALVESQRSWIQQRNSTCAAVAGTAVWSCIMDMTRQRIAALSDSQQPSESLPSPQPNLRPQAQSAQKDQSIVGQPTAASATPSNVPRALPSPNASSSEGPNPLLVVLFGIGTVIGAIAVFSNIQKRQRLMEEKRRAEAERQRLIAKYGDDIAERILKHLIWQGMTEDQLIESWGPPADRDYEVRHTKTKETWKYGQVGRNRFSSRVFIENGYVVGWKQ